MRLALTSPADDKDLVPIVSQPFQPASDTERMDYSSGNPDISEGFHMQRSGQAPKVVCKIVIRHPENPDLVLFGLRREENKWCVPGGHADAGESPLDAMFREFREECGLELSSAEHVASVRVLDRPVIVHVFEGRGPSPEIWDSINSVDDPDSEFVSFQYVDPFDMDFPLHVPASSNAILYYLSGKDRKEGMYNSLMDLTTEKEAARHYKKSQLLSLDFSPILEEESCYLCGGSLPDQPWYAFVMLDGQQTAAPLCAACDSKDRVAVDLGRNDTYWPKAPDSNKFRRTDEAISQSYTNENAFEDPDLKLGAAVPYDSNGMSPADPMNESFGDVQIQQHAKQGTSVSSRYRRLCGRRPDVFARLTAEDKKVFEPSDGEVKEGGFQDKAQWQEEVKACEKTEVRMADVAPSMFPGTQVEHSKGLSLQNEQQREDASIGGQNDLSVRQPRFPE